MRANRWPIFLLALVLLTMACNLPSRLAASGTETPTPSTTAEMTASPTVTQLSPTTTLLPTMIPPSPTEVPPTPVPPTLIPPTPIPPTRIPPTPLPAMIRIKFNTGATSAAVNGNLPKGGVIYYVLQALQGQTMLVAVFSPNNDVYLGVTGLSDGRVLLSTVSRQTQFNGTLPATQDYQLVLYSPNRKSSYTLQVIIPVRIRFAPGAISDSVTGTVISGQMNSYLLRASKGQTMTVKITSPNNDVLLSIYGMSDGNTLARPTTGVTQWTGVLPGTQDYMIEAVAAGATTNYTLDVTVK